MNLQMYGIQVYLFKELLVDPNSYSVSFAWCAQHQEDKSSALWTCSFTRSGLFLIFFDIQTTTKVRKIQDNMFHYNNSSSDNLHIA